MIMESLRAVHYLPIATTLVSLGFLLVLVKAARTRRSGPHLWWWAAGAASYGLGTLLESIVTLSGNSVFLTKSWYIAGALLGGYPLAQGVAYLLYNRRIANFLTIITVPFIVFASFLVIASPAVISALEPHRPSGAVLGWSWIRYFTPLINLYAFALLVGGAVLSAARYKKTGERRERVVGNVLIAIGGTLPGIGGAMAKGGLVEGLYVGEFLGLLFIWWGYWTISAAKHVRATIDSAPHMVTTHPK